MSKLRRRSYLKTRFEDGDRPNGNDFAELISSSLNQKSDQIFAVNQMLGIGTKAPEAPLEVKGCKKKHKQSVIVADGDNSTFRISHPINNVVAIGSDLGESMQIGNFDCKNGNYFEPQMYISKGRVGIGAEAENAELDVKTTLWVGESIGLGGGKLYFEDDKLYLKTDKQTYEILTKNTNHKPYRKLILVLIILGSILLLLVIVLIIIYLLKKNGQ